MRQALHHLYPVVAVALLAAGVVWLERISRAVEEAIPAQDSSPGFIVETASIRGFDTEGALRYAMDAEKLTHYPARDITRMDKPVLWMNSDEGEVKLVAEMGNVIGSGDRVDFSGSVQGERLQDGKEDLHFSSETLTVWPDRHRAVSNSPVVLTQGATIAEGDSMEADNLFGQFTLRGNTKVTMPPG